MKKIGKRVIAIALAMCAVSSTTAFAINEVKPHDSYYNGVAYRGIYYSFTGEAYAETTRYSNVFDFRTNSSSPCDLECSWELKDYNSKTLIRKDSYSEENTCDLYDFASVPLTRSGKVIATCTHSGSIEKYRLTSVITQVIS